MEARLRAAVSRGAAEEAIEIAGEIQQLFSDRRHHRLLKAKLWAFEAALDANRLAYAETGFIGVRKLANRGTRIHLEATSLLAVCLLRQKKNTEAKRAIREVIQNLDDIASDRSRHKFQKRFIERIEQECILAELIGTDTSPLDAAEMHRHAVRLVQYNSDNEILRLIGNAVPSSSIKLLQDVRHYSIKLLPLPDRKLLPSPGDTEKPLSVGKRTAAVLKRIAWKSLCDPDSEVYKLWSKKVPAVFNGGYFAGALATTMAAWRIGIPIIGTGVAAIAMKSSAEVFCEFAKPEGMMIDRSERDEE